MRDVRNRQAIFTSLKNAITTTRGVAQGIAYGDQRVDRVMKETTLEIPSFGFSGAEGDTVTVTVYPGSQVDNRDLTADSVHFSYGGREYESEEYYHTDSGVDHGLRMMHEGYWRRAEQVFAPGDNVKIS